MKKTNFMVVALMLVALLLAACGQTTVDEETPSKPSASSPVNLEGGVEDSVFDESEPTQPTTGSQAATQPSQGATEPSQAATQPTEPSVTQPTTPAETQPTTPTTPADPEPVDPATMDYLTFQNMTGAEQRAFQESFADLDAFFEWYYAAKERYETENPPIEIGPDGVVDLGGLGG